MLDSPLEQLMSMRRGWLGLCAALVDRYLDLIVDQVATTLRVLVKVDLG